MIFYSELYSWQRCTHGQCGHFNEFICNQIQLDKKLLGFFNDDEMIEGLSLFGSK